MLVCLDPGHGGTDPGAVGYVTEKNVNLEIARAAERRLLLWGANVVLTRDRDQTVSLADRCQIANGADVFVSIHCNAGGGTGFESFRATDGDQKLQECIHGKVAGLGVADRGQKARDWYVLRNVPMPAVLVECLFVDTVEDAALLKDPAFIEKMGCAIADGIAEYLELEDLFMGTFKDVPAGAWYAGAVADADKFGLMGGYPDGTFRPNEHITRAEAASMAVRLYMKTAEEERINQVIAANAPRTVTVYALSEGGTPIGGGSGVLIAPDRVLTNAHVVANAAGVEIQANYDYSDPRYWQAKAEVIKQGAMFDSNGNPFIPPGSTGKHIDLAVLKMNRSLSSITPVKFAEQMPDDGDFLVIIGSPQLIKGWASFGIVSRKTNYFIDTDAAINPGNSGGGAFNLNGEYVGAPVQKYVGAEIDNMGNVIRADAARLWLDGKEDQIKF